MNLLKPLRPPVIDLEAHWFDLYNHTPKDGIIPSSVGDTSRLPQPGRGYKFNGVDNRLIGSNSDLEIISDTNSIYFRCELRVEDNSDMNGTLLRNQSSVGFLLRYNDGFIDFLLSDDFTTWKFQDSGSILLTTDRPHEVIFYYHNGELWLYIDRVLDIYRNTNDGVPLTLGYNGNIANTRATLIGTNSGSVQQFEGFLFSYLFTTEPVSDVFDIENNFQLPNGLFFKCEDTGLIAFDSSGNGNHGTKVNTDVLAANTFSYEGDNVPKSYLNEEGYFQDTRELCLDTDGNPYGVFNYPDIATLKSKGVVHPDNQITSSLSLVNEEGKNWVRSDYDGSNNIISTNYYFSHLPNYLSREGIFRVKFKIKGSLGGATNFQIRLITNAAGGIQSLPAGTQLLDGNVKYIEETKEYYYDFQLQANNGSYPSYNYSTYQYSVYLNIRLYFTTTGWFQITDLECQNIEKYPKVSTPALEDILGRPLTYKGKVSYPAKLVESNCVSFDWG